MDSSTNTQLTLTSVSLFLWILMTACFPLGAPRINTHTHTHSALPSMFSLLPAVTFQSNFLFLSVCFLLFLSAACLIVSACLSFCFLHLSPYAAGLFSFIVLTLCPSVYFFCLSLLLFLLVCFDKRGRFYRHACGSVMLHYNMYQPGWNVLTIAHLSLAC